MKNYIITEGSFDKRFLEKVLPQNLLSRTQFMEGMGYSSAVSLAKSIFVNGNAKILLVLDANTSNEDEIRQKENFIRNSFSLIASDSEYKLLYFVPEIETLLFVDKNFIETTFNVQINQLEYELAKSNPKASLKKFAKTNDYSKMIEHCLNTLSADIVQQIQKMPIIQEIIEYNN